MEAASDVELDAAKTAVKYTWNQSTLCLRVAAVRDLSFCDPRCTRGASVRRATPAERKV